MKLAVYLLLVALAVSLLFRQLQWPWVIFRQGETAFDRGDYLDAAALFERAAVKLDDRRLLERLAQCWLAAGRSDKAETVLGHLLEHDPEQLPAIKLLAGLYQKNQQPRKAIPLFFSYLAAGKKLDPPAELQLARIYRQALLYEDAAPHFVQAAKDPKQKVVAEVELADMRSWQGRYDEAVQGFRQVLAANPANRSARLSLARVLTWAGNYKESEDEYRRLLTKP